MCAQAGFLVSWKGRTLLSSSSTSSGNILFLFLISRWMSLYLPLIQDLVTRPTCGYTWRTNKRSMKRRMCARRLYPPTNTHRQKEERKVCVWRWIVFVGEGLCAAMKGIRQDRFGRTLNPSPGACSFLSSNSNFGAQHLLKREFSSAPKIR